MEANVSLVMKTPVSIILIIFNSILWVLEDAFEFSALKEVLKSYKNKHFSCLFFFFNNIVF